MIYALSLRREALLGLLLAFGASSASTAFAQDRPARAERKAAAVERLTESLDLTDTQRQLLLDTEAQPGALWDAAAALTPTLTDAQKEALFARPKRPDGEMRRGGKGRRGDRRGDRPGEADRAERQAAGRAAMRSALDLTDEQVAQLDAIREAHQAQYRSDPSARRARMQAHAAGEVPPEVAAVLTPAQQEVFKVHHALRMQMHPGRPHRGGGR